MRQIFVAALASALAAFLLSAPARAVNNSFPTSGATLICGGPYYDVKCAGAIGDGVADDTAALRAAWAAAITAGLPLRFSPGTYLISSQVVFDATGASPAVQIMSDAATIDATPVSSLPGLAITHSGGTTASPAVDIGLSVRDLTVKCSVANYCVQIGKRDLSDRFDSTDIRIRVSNASTDPAAGGVLLNFLRHSRLQFSIFTAGGSSSTGALALEQVQDSTIGGRANANGATAPSVLIENGASTGNTIAGMDWGASNTCLSVTVTTSPLTIIGPRWSCATAVNAVPNGGGVMVIGAVYAGNNRGPISQGVQIVGRGSLSQYVAPSSGSYTAAGVDDGEILSSISAGGTLTITLPMPGAVGANWTIAGTTRGGNALIFSSPSAPIRAGQVSTSTLTLPGSVPAGGAQTREFVQLISTGVDYQVATISQATALANGVSPSLPVNWEYPAGGGYAATVLDGGYVISSGSTSAGLALMLPTVNTLNPGWTIGVLAPSLGVPITISTPGPESIVAPGGLSGMTYSPPVNQVILLQWDGVNNWRALNGQDPRSLLHIPNNAAMQALVTVPGEMVIRDGVLSPSDGPVGTPAVPYIATGALCGLNSGAGDGGTQIPSANGGCLTIASPQPYDLRLWGGVGSATTLTGSITNGGHTLSLPGGTGDFQQGQSVAIAGAGGLGSALSPPLTPPAAPVIGTIPVPGTTVYCYRISAYTLPVGATGGHISAPGAEMCTGTGPAILGFPFEIAQALGTTWFGPSQYVPISWAPSSRAQGYIIWSGHGSNTETFGGVTAGTSYNDYGPIQARPWWIPATLPTAEIGGIRTTTLTAVGVNQAMIAAAAGTTTSTAIMRHDDDPAMTAATQSGAAPAIDLPCGFTFQLFAPLLPAANQTIKGRGWQCSTIASTSGVDALQLSQIGGTLGDFTIDATGMVGGNAVDCVGGQQITFQGRLGIVNPFNGFLFQPATTGGQACRLVNFNEVYFNAGETRGTYQFYVYGPLPAGTPGPPNAPQPPASIFKIHDFLANKAHQGNCFVADGDVATIFADTFTCQATALPTVEIVNTPNGGVSGGKAIWNSPRGIRFDKLYLNECPYTCLYGDWETQVSFGFLWAQTHPGNGAASINVQFTPNAREVSIQGGKVFGGDGGCLLTNAFIFDMVGTDVGGCSFKAPGTAAAVEVGAGASGTVITGGGDYSPGEQDDEPTSPVGYGILIDPGSQNTVINGGLWVGAIAGWHDNCSPNPMCMVTIAGLPFGSPPDTIINGGSTVWAAATYPALYSCNGVGVLWRGDSGANLSDTTDTATNIVNTMGARGCKIVAGTAFHIRIFSNANGTISILGGAGVTLSSPITIPASSASGNGQTIAVDLVGVVTAVGGSPAITLQGCSQNHGQAC